MNRFVLSAAFVLAFVSFACVAETQGPEPATVADETDDTSAKEPERTPPTSASTPGVAPKLHSQLANVDLQNMLQ